MIWTNCKLSEDISTQVSAFLTKLFCSRFSNLFLSILYIFLCKNSIPLRPHPTSGDHDLNKLESTLREDDSTHSSYSFSCPIVCEKISKILTNFQKFQIIYPLALHLNKFESFTRWIFQLIPIGSKEVENVNSLQTDERTNAGLKVIRKANELWVQMS